MPRAAGCLNDCNVGGSRRIDTERRLSFAEPEIDRGSFRSRNRSMDVKSLARPRIVVTSQPMAAPLLVKLAPACHGLGKRLDLRPDECRPRSSEAPLRHFCIAGAGLPERRGAWSWPTVIHAGFP